MAIEPWKIRAVKMALENFKNLTIVFALREYQFNSSGNVLLQTRFRLGPQPLVYSNTQLGNLYMLDSIISLVPNFSSQGA